MIRAITKEAARDRMIHVGLKARHFAVFDLGGKAAGRFADAAVGADFHGALAR